MKFYAKTLMTAAAATMTVAPAMAAPANPAAPLSVAKSVRADAAVAKDSKLGGENGGLVIALAVGVAIIVAIIVAGSIGEKDATSP